MGVERHRSEAGPVIDDQCGGEGRDRPSRDAPQCGQAAQGRLVLEPGLFARRADEDRVATGDEVAARSVGDVADGGLSEAEELPSYRTDGDAAREPGKASRPCSRRENEATGREASAGAS